MRAQQSPIAEARRSDTLQIDLAGAEMAMVKNNLQLLARRYDIETARLKILQAKLWDNPSFYVSTNPRNNATENIFTMFLPRMDPPTAMR